MKKNNKTFTKIKITKLSKELLNIAALKKQTQNLGPGNRFAIWVQGCPFNCKNCVSKNWIPFEVANVFSIAELAEQIILESEITGITISGGEPMMQAGRLAKLLKAIKIQRPELNVIVFTGFVLKQLVWEDALEFIKEIDVLITGLYVEKLNDDKGLRGSSNQEIHFLSDKFENQKEYFYGRKRDLEFHVQNDGVMMVGIPEKNFKW